MGRKPSSLSVDLGRAVFGGSAGEPRRGAQEQIERGRVSERGRGGGEEVYDILGALFHRTPRPTDAPFYPIYGKVAVRAAPGVGISAPGDKNVKQKADYVTEG